MITERFIRLGELTASLVLLSSLAFAQSQANTGIIEGTVSDPSGKSVAKAQITITNLGTNFTRSLVSDDEGRFRGLLLPLGPYRVTTKAPNFGTNIREGLDLAVGQTISLAVVLGISQVEQVVSVSAEAPILESGRVENSTYLDQRSVRDLPNNGRNFLSLVPLTPGVSIVQGPDGDEISINGQKGINNNVSIDGADNNNPFFGEQRGGQRPPFTVSLDAIKEFQVVADSAPAEFGRSSGGFINVVTKSGTNSTHGTLHEYQKWTGLTSRLSDGTRLSAFSQEQFGGTVGGAVVKNKLFYFGAVDQQFFTQTKQTNAQRIDPALVNFFATKFSDPNENAPITRENNATAALGKVDWYATSNNLFTARYNFARARQPNGTFDVDSWGTSANAIERDFSNTVSFQLNTTLGHHAERSALPVLSRRSPARLHRPFPSRPKPPTTGYRNRFCGTVSFRATLFHSGQRSRHAVPGQRQRFGGTRRSRFQIRRRTQPHLHHADVHRLRQRTLYLRQRQRLHELCVNGPKFVSCSDGSTNNNGNLVRAGPPSPDRCYSSSSLPASTAKPPRMQVRRPYPTWNPRYSCRTNGRSARTRPWSYGLRWDAQLEPDPITRPNRFSSRCSPVSSVPVYRQYPVLQDTVPTARRSGLVARQGSQDAGSTGRRNLLRAYARAESGQYPLHQRLCRPIHLSRK